MSTVSSASADLFGAPELPGLVYAESLLSDAEERALIERINTYELTPFRFQGWLGKRLTVTFGWSYDFEAATFGRRSPIPEEFHPIRERAASFAGLCPDALEQLLLTRYDVGAGIGWHRDRPVFEQVIGISLGASAPMRFRRRLEEGFERRTIPLAPRSIYVMSGEARHDWEHSIGELRAPRWSITFRTLSEKGRAKAGQRSV